jgi:hypothetical protein
MPTVWAKCRRVPSRRLDRGLRSSGALASWLAPRKTASKNVSYGLNQPQPAQPLGSIHFHQRDVGVCFQLAGVQLDADSKDNSRKIPLRVLSHQEISGFFEGRIEEQDQVDPFPLFVLVGDITIARGKSLDFSCCELRSWWLRPPSVRL